mmetsp:Transcript_41572/g.99937  ORF Transcript_41572/g.99937 Transcript_41572/m.99937 type:complete len:303 (+) Transcript_41572:1323-2231(+)
MHRERVGSGRDHVLIVLAVVSLEHVSRDRAVPAERNAREDVRCLLGEAAPCDGGDSAAQRVLHVHVAALLEHRRVVRHAGCRLRLHPKDPVGSRAHGVLGCAAVPPTGPLGRLVGRAHAMDDLFVGHGVRNKGVGLLVARLPHVDGERARGVRWDARELVARGEPLTVAAERFVCNLRVAALQLVLRVHVAALVCVVVHLPSHHRAHRDCAVDGRHGLVLRARVVAADRAALTVNRLAAIDGRPDDMLARVVEVRVLDVDGHVALPPRLDLVAMPVQAQLDLVDQNGGVIQDGGGVRLWRRW